MQVDESNLLVWQGLLVPDSAPYNKVTIHKLYTFCSKLLLFKGLEKNCGSLSFSGSFPDRHCFPCRVPFQTTQGNHTLLTELNIMVSFRCPSVQRSTTPTLMRRDRCSPCVKFGNLFGCLDHHFLYFNKVAAKY